MQVGVLVFPGSNCDDDIVHVSKTVLGAKVTKIWHKESSLSKLGNFDLIIVPGGFSYGDYLRSGAIARFSSIMHDVIQFARDGGYVWGICNGFQILCEAGLLPGVLLPNQNQKFVCKNAFLKCKTSESPITSLIEREKILKIPVAHADGRYYADNGVLQELKDQNQILFTYCSSSGEETVEANFNGSSNNIAGICNVNRNVFGMMPHPERASESVLGNTDGKIMFDSFASALALV